MRWKILLPLLLLVLVAACSDVTGLGGRSLDGEWRATIDGEDVWVSLQDDRGEVWGDGAWGYDDVYVSGDRTDSDVYLRFEFDRYDPIELEGTIRGGAIEGRLYGSGLDGEFIRFYRE